MKKVVPGVAARIGIADSADPQPVRIEEIVPVSARTEAAHVLRAVAVILISLWLYRANIESGAAKKGGTNDRSPAPAVADSNQKYFGDLAPGDQRMFRAMHEGLVEAENIRSSSGAWPMPATLAQRGIPPFADDPITKNLYRWTLHREGTLINYLGRSADSRLPAFLIFILEPTPGAPPDPAPLDELHHQLASGDKLHVSVWMHPAGTSVPDAAIGVPEARGWTQLLSGAPQSPSTR